jgi:hypothetical protein
VTITPIHDPAPPAPSPNAGEHIDEPAPGPGASTQLDDARRDSAGAQLRVGDAGRDLHSPTTAPADASASSATSAVAGERRRWWRATPEDLPDGVLRRARWDVTTTVAVIATAAMAEAGYNLAHFVYDILKLPAPLAIAFPVIAEATAVSFAIQDLRDRRHGHASTAMRAATYLTLAMSSAVNGVVGYAIHGLGGLLEILPPMVLAAVIHLHGDRASHAWHSRAVLRPSWRAAQLRAAQVESVMDILPLLAGNDHDGKATVTLLRRRLEAGTLEPGDALIAAGWHERESLFWLDLGDTAHRSRMRRLETVAATVWGSDGPPPAPPSLVVTGTRARGTRGAGAGSGGSAARSSGGSGADSAGGSSGGSGADSAGGSSGGSGPRRSLQELRARTIGDLQAELVEAVHAQELPADASAQAIRVVLQTSPKRSRQLRDWLATTPLPAQPITASDLEAVGLSPVIAQALTSPPESGDGSGGSGVSP